MFTTIGLFVAKYLGKSVISERASRMIGIGVLIFAAVLGIITWLAIHDAKVSREALDRRDVKIAKDVAVASQKANELQDKRNDVFRTEQIEIATATLNAVEANPVETRKPTGAASQAYYEALRKQQGKKK